MYSKFSNDLGVAWGLAMGASALVGALYDLAALSATVLGTLTGVLFLALVPTSRLRPLSLRSISTTVPSRQGAEGISTSLAALALTPLWLAGVARATTTVASVLSMPIAGWLVAIICGAIVSWITRLFPQRSVRPSARAVLLAGLLVPLGVGTLLPAIGAAFTGLLGLFGVALSLASDGVRSADGSSGSHDGRGQEFQMGLGPSAAGFALGSLGLAHLVSTPWVSSDPFVIGVLVAAVLVGAAIGYGIGPRGALLGTGLAALGLASAAELPPRLPALAIALIAEYAESSDAIGYVLPLLVMGWVGALVGLGAGTLGVGRRTTVGGLLGAIVVWQFAPSLLGADEALHTAIGVLALLSVPVAIASSSVGSRLLGLALPAAAAATVLLPAPGPSSLPTEEAWRRLGSGRELGAAMSRSERLQLDFAADSRGRVSMSAFDGSLVAWQRGGRRTALDAADRHADRFLGHLPALLSAEPPREVLIYGLGRGEIVNAARQSSPGRVEVVEPSSAVRRIVRRNLPDVSALLADPAVRLRRTDPLAERASWDAVIVDASEPWAFGAGAELAPERLRRIRDRLAPDGIAIFRLPLDSLSPSELATIGVRAGTIFPTVIAWLDPVDAKHLVLTAWRDERRPSVATLLEAWKRDILRDDLISAGLRSPGDLLERTVTDRQGLALLGAGGRDAAGTAVVAAARARRGKNTLPLAALASAGRPVSSMVSLDGLPPEERESLEERLQTAESSRESYLSLLGFLAQGKTKEAIGRAAEVAASSNDPARDLRALIGPWLRRGQAMRRSGQFERARAELSTAYAFSPTDVDVNLELARTLISLDKPDDAAAYVQRARDADPTSVEPVLLLADVRVAQGRLADAAQGLSEAEPLFPTEVRLLVNLGYILTQLSVGSDETIARRLARARVLFQRAASLSPRLAQPRAGLAEVYYRHGEGKSALNEIDRALILDPNCRYRSWRGHILAELGRLDEAEATLQKAVLECANLVDALVMLGAVSADLRKPREAREMWERVLLIDPTHVAARENLATLENSKLDEFVDQTQP